MSDLRRFEDQLRDSLRRVEPPAGLEQRILARVEGRRNQGRRRWLAAAASVVFVLGGAYGVHYRQQRIEERQVEVVRQQFTFALQITAKHLSRTEGQLKAIGVRQIELVEAGQ